MISIIQINVNECIKKSVFTGSMLYTVHRSGDSDRVYVTDLTSLEQRIVAVLASRVVGQLSMLDNDLYYYSSHERRLVNSICCVCE